MPLEGEREDSMFGDVEEPPEGAARCVVANSGGLEEAADWLPAGAGVVVGLEHLELVALDEVFAGEEDGRDAALLDEAAEALGVDAEFAGCLDEVEVVLKGGVGHWGARLVLLDQVLTHRRE